MQIGNGRCAVVVGPAVGVSGRDTNPFSLKLASMFRINRLFGFAASLVLTLFSCGCRKTDAFYVSPQHSDLGFVDSDLDNVEVQFKIHNGLDRDVRVVNIYPSCLCSTVDLVDNPVPAGGETVLVVRSDMARSSGMQNVSVVLTTDSPAYPELRLSFRATVPVGGEGPERSFRIGSFLPNSPIDMSVPVVAFSRASVTTVISVIDDGSGLVDSVFVEGPPPKHFGSRRQRQRPSAISSSMCEC